MSQNMEQNVRTRDKQVIELTESVKDFDDYDGNREVALRHILRAEARCAGEQRRKDGALSRAKLSCQNEQEASDRTLERADVVQWQKDRSKFFLSSTLEVVNEYAAWRDKKDAEGQEPVAWVSKPTLQDILAGYEGTLHLGYDETKYSTEPLYTRPANVAALEARIAELVEAEQLARADVQASKARVKVQEEEKNHEFNRGYLIHVVMSQTCMTSPLSRAMS